MRVCNKCGVELDDTMTICPLCERPVIHSNDGRNLTYGTKTAGHGESGRKHLMQRVLWQVTSVLLLSGIIATLVINLSIHGAVTWSIYPVSICLMIFCYASLMALWHTRIVLQILGGWVISAFVLIAVYWYSNLEWPIKLALPLLCAANVIVLVCMLIIGNLKNRGLNVLAMLLAAISVLCLMIEGIVSRYFEGVVRLQWSVIVAACLLPVIVAVVFMFLRTRKNPELQKIFHT